ncbi:CheR family methyltransferase [Methylobacterium sp. ID0610]|uniref:CheR family methyltransferase n=1 Tax=Methylobacterium carpenticola TaxID=3344827 RepID=UPI0036934A77
MGSLIPRAPTDDPAFAALKAAIVARTGHHYYADKDDLLWDRLRPRLRSAAIPDAGAYLALLRESEAEWEALEAAITIGETFFFRYAEQFAALRRTILPERIAARGAERRLRIWSAGCSTGPETYSLAILLHELLGEDLPTWRVALTGTDINRDVLAVARKAEYGVWALRSLSAEDRARYFRPGTRESTFALRPEFRGLARFEPQNLLHLVGGTASLAFTDYDLILCRNVLIYFHPDTVTAVVRALASRLRPGGWLLLGHAEPNPAFAEILRPVSLPGTAAYRRQEAEEAEEAEAAAPVPPEPAAPAPPPLRPVRARTRPLLPPRRPLPAEPPPAPDPDRLATVRDLADAGDLDASWRACRAALQADPTDARLRFYEGLLARARARPDEAERAFRGAVYLDKGFVMAHYHLGLTLIAAGRAEAGRRAIANALRLAAALAPEAPLAEGDGLTAARLADAAQPLLGAVTA